MGNIMISAWFVMVRGVCWWLNQPINALIVMEQGLKWWENFQIDARYAEVQVGPTYLKIPRLYVEWLDAAQK